MVSFSNSAWIPEDSIYPYLKLRDKYQGATRIPRGFKEAIEAIEDAWQALPVRSGFCSTCHTGFLKVYSFTPSDLECFFSAWFLLFSWMKVNVFQTVIKHFFLNTQEEKASKPELRFQDFKF